MTTELALRGPVTLFPTQAEWAMLKEQATMAVKSGLLPRAVDTPEKAIIIALKGRELGIPPMQAFSHIHIVDGKPTMSAEMMLALIYKNAAGAVVNYVESTDKKCAIEARRHGHNAAIFTYTIEEAKLAGLLNKKNWQSYPAAMLRARAVAIVARAVFPDAIQGCSHTPEELGAEVNDEGEVIVVPPSPEENKPEPDKKPASAPAAAKARGRKEIGAEIMAVANDLGLSKDEVEQWAIEDFKKSGRELTLEEMETFLGTLQSELGRRGEIA